MPKKRIGVLYAAVPFVHDETERIAKELTRRLRGRGYEAETVAAPLRERPFNALLDGYMTWRMADLTQSDGERIDLLIALAAPAFMTKHPNQVVWLTKRLYRDGLCERLGEAGNGAASDEAERVRRIAAMDRAALGEAKGVFAASKLLARRVQEGDGVAAVPLYCSPVIDGGYEEGSFGDYVFYSGRLTREKRVSLLIEAIARCDRGLRLRIAGCGAQETALRRLARELNVEDRVEFLGAVSDGALRALYADALAVGCPAPQSDSPYAAMEAFLSRKPVVACCDSGATLEFARDGENALVTPPQADAFAEGLNELYRHRERARELGRGGYDAVRGVGWDCAVDMLTCTIR